MNKSVTRTKAKRWRTLSQLHELNFPLVLPPPSLPFGQAKENKTNSREEEEEKKLCAKAVRLFVLLISCVFLPCLAAAQFDLKTHCVYFFFEKRSSIHRSIWIFMQFKFASTVQCALLLLLIAVNCTSFALRSYVRLSFSLRSISFRCLGTKIMPNQKWLKVTDDYFFF